MFTVYSYISRILHLIDGNYFDIFTEAGDEIRKSNY